MNIKEIITYTGRRARRVPTRNHTCLFTVVYKVKGQQARFQCDACPNVCEWVPVRLLDSMAREQVDAYRVMSSMKPVKVPGGGVVLRAPENMRLSSLQRAARVFGGRLHATLTDENTGQVIYDSREPDDHGQSEDVRAKLMMMTKPVLMEQYGDKCDMFKSWTKEKMVAAILDADLA